MRVACIGSRAIEEAEEQAFETIGGYLAQFGHTVASGNAKGSDQAFARGANKVNPEKVELCVPWERYEKPSQVVGNKIRVVGNKGDPAFTAYYTLAEAHHPAWPRLKQSVRKLMGRNAMIVMNSGIVVARLNHAKQGGGGTGHGVRIAESLGIRVIDVSDQKTLQRLLSHIRMKRKAQCDGQ